MEDRIMKKRTNIFKIITLLFFIGQSMAAHAEGVSLSPATLVLPAAGKTFSVNVAVTGAVDLGGFQFNINYNPAIVKVLAVGDAVVGAFPNSTGRTVTALPAVIDNVAGKVTFGAFSFGVPAGANGAGTLATVMFTVQSPAADALALSGMTIANTASTARPVNITGGTALSVAPPTPRAGGGGGGGCAISAGEQSPWEFVVFLLLFMGIFMRRRLSC